MPADRKVRARAALHAWKSISVSVTLALLGVWVSACTSRAPDIIPPIQAAPAPQAAAPARETFEATAYSVYGKTATGRGTRRGIVAADPGVLPIGSSIRVLDAGQYSGTYAVADTGRAIRGRKIDIFIPDEAEALRFGKRAVQVERVDAPVQP